MSQEEGTKHLKTNDEEIQDELPLLTFNALYNILREEKKSKSLQKYPPLFYEALEKFIMQKKETIKNEQNQDKRKKELNILNNAKKISEEIISLRGQKIAKIATSNALSENKILDEEHILQYEEELYTSFTKQIQKIIKKIQ